MSKNKRQKVFLGNGQLKSYPDENIVDVWSGLGVYCGSFCITKKYTKLLIKQLKDNPDRYFKVRK
mgnify:CR=1 FL=1